MHRFVPGLLCILLLSSCVPTDLTGLQQELTLAAEGQLKKMLAARLKDQLGTEIDAIVSSLAEPGGYLDNPLVRILLPPPLGLALSVTRDLYTDPQATLLEALMNQAAERAIPGAAPILRAVLAQVTPAEAQTLLAGGNTTVTQYLKSKTMGTLYDVLAPQVATTLSNSGAPLVYAELVEEQAQLPESTVGDEGAILKATAIDLKRYVVDQAIEGLFKALGVQEQSLRRNLDQTIGEGLLPGIVPGPAVVIAADK